MAFSTLSFREHISRLSGRKLGAFKRAASIAGITLDEYVDKVERGLKRCVDCSKWVVREDFVVDESRWDGLAAKCFRCASTRQQNTYIPVSAEQCSRMGPTRDQMRDGDKLQARHFVNLDVQSGRRPNPNSLYCVKCGHRGTDRRHEYHHHMGYSVQHFYDVVPLCTTCHSSEHESSSMNKTESSSVIEQPALSKTVECLNSAFAADPNAIHALVVNRVPCNQALADHPHVVVDNPPVIEGQHFSVGALGLVNGILTANGLPRIGVKFEPMPSDQEGRFKIVGFGESNQGRPTPSTARPLPSIEELWEIYSHLQTLRSEEASQVTFTASNPDPDDGFPLEVVEVRDLWTEWLEVDFRGATLLECLRKAVDARRAWYVEKEAKRLKLLPKT